MLSALKKILDFSGDEKKNIYHSIWVSFLFAIFHMLQISAIYFIVKAVSEKDMSMTPAWIALILLVVSIVGRSIANYYSQLQQCHASYFMVANKRISIGEMFKKIPMGFFNGNNGGEVVGISTTVLEDVENTAAMVMVNTLSGFINTIIFTLMILIFEWRIGFIVTVGSLLYLVILSKMEKKSREVLPKRQMASAKLVDTVLEQIGGMSVIKSFNLTGKGDEKVRGAIENTRKTNLDCEKLFTPYTIVQNILLDLFSILIIGAGIFFYQRGELSFLNTVMTIIISFLAFSQIKLAGSATTALRVVSGSIEQTKKLEEFPQMDIEGKDIKPANFNISFENVEFAYSGKKILDDISVDIPQNQMTAIVGPSGAGKTTFCNLIARFWDIDNGKISIGGHNIKEYSLESLMKQISMVFQNVYLFQDTIENNIKFAKPNATHEEVVDAAKKACCHDFIMNLPEQYQTVIGEGGASLSGGEKQRISIARAMIKNAPIIIFDEATANVDPENEDKLQLAMEELTRNKTVIMIAHRLKTIKNANQILVLANGKIMQKGTHEELIQTDGIYRNFVEARQVATKWQLS
ncbi:TPA: ABC transporter ATP-binding protein [Streptococcus pyogenes]|uniref:ATP-binding cassette domain-containing protein n=4 Tax=Bacteria TaxID=2 RepID=A0A0T7ZLS3_STREE|nr:MULTISPECIES: ABC transporter ATP-binding protein [Bacteria]HEQ9856164.1 ABC transporter ATP-binding protein [Streptococcus pyogenes serotype M1]HER4608008.1 ABC transporter ATP-binding protein [Streptococcus pyogenes NGAS532]HER4800030.1 ABC transporter ATP-binding protein [Streptococcus pyogenes NGAS113]AIW24892.1 ABC transporter related protein [Streptococcus pyogenes]AKP81924.1 Putative multidrug export ATP-binding/permease protein [Streptococcus pyogenes]